MPHQRCKTRTSASNEWPKVLVHRHSSAVQIWTAVPPSSMSYLSSGAIEGARGELEFRVHVGLLGFFAVADWGELRGSWGFSRVSGSLLTTWPASASIINAVAQQIATSLVPLRTFQWQSQNIALWLPGHEFVDVSFFIGDNERPADETIMPSIDYYLSCYHDDG